MGVESKFYVLPDTSGFRPGAAKVIQLVRELRTTGSLCDPKSPKFLASCHPIGRAPLTGDNEGFVWELARRKSHCGSLHDLEQSLSESQEADVLIAWSNSELEQSGLKYPLTVVPGFDRVY